MSATGGGGRGGLGWTILLAALAVPSFLFYNWWARLSGERTVGTRSRSRPADGAVFQTPPSNGRLVNPIPPSVPAPAVRTQAPLPVSAPAGSPVSAPPQDLRTAPVPVATASVSAPTGMPMRDPMLSPDDLQKLEDAAHAKDRSARKQPRGQGKSDASIEKHVELQGVVDKPDGESLAIVNNNTMGRGDSFSVRGYAGKVKILKVSPSGVVFEYKGRKFAKRITEE